MPPRDVKSEQQKEERRIEMIGHYRGKHYMGKREEESRKQARLATLQIEQFMEYSE
jgi:hypothetical protein